MESGGALRGSPTYRKIYRNVAGDAGFLVFLMVLSLFVRFLEGGLAGLVDLSD